MGATIERAEFDKKMVSPVNELLRTLDEKVFNENIDIDKLGFAVGLITDFVWEYALASHAPSEAAYREGMMRAASMMETVIDQLEAKGFRFVNPAREGVAYVREAAERMASEAAAQPCDCNSCRIARGAHPFFTGRSEECIKSEIEHNDH